MSFLELGTSYRLFQTELCMPYSCYVICKEVAHVMM